MDHKINIVSTLHNSELIYEEDADMLYPQLEKAISNKEKISLSFLEVKHTSTLFMNALIGRLYQQFGLNVDEYLSITDTPNEIISNLIARVKDRALKSSVYAPIFNEALTQ